MSLNNLPLKGFLSKYWNYLSDYFKVSDTACEHLFIFCEYFVKQRTPDNFYKDHDNMGAPFPLFHSTLSESR